MSSPITINDSVVAKINELETTLAELRKIVGLGPLSAAAAPAGKTKKQRAPKEAKEKRAPSEGNMAWVAKVNETVTQMRAEGWETWTDASGNVWAASKPATVDGRETHVFSDTEKEPTYPKGGLARASYLKTKDSPEELEKTRLRAEKRAEALAKKTATAAALESGAPVEEKPKAKRVISEEQKAKMQAGRVAAKAASAAAKEAAAAAPAPAAPATPAAPAAAAPAAAAPAKMKIQKKKAEEKVFDLSFNAWTFSGEDYITNERGDVLTLEGDWVGRFNGKAIDESVARPTDIDAFLDME